MIQNGMKKEEIAKLLNLSLDEVEKYIEFIGSLKKQMCKEDPSFKKMRVFA